MKLIDYLKLSNKSQKDFASETCFSEATISSWISGRRTPSLKALQKIMQYTKGAVTPSDFMVE